MEITSAVIVMRVSMFTNKNMIPAFLLFKLVATVHCQDAKLSEDGEDNLANNAFVLSSLFTDAVIIPIYY